MAGGTDGNWVLTKSKRTDTRANLTISNRDTEAFEFALEFDKESCRWNKLTRDESVVNEKERFLHAIVNFIKNRGSAPLGGDGNRAADNLTGTRADSC